MAAINPVREALSTGRFCYMVELVAGAKSTEEHLVEIAAGFMQAPGVVAGSVTSFAGGSAGLDPVRVGAAMQASGLTSNIHLTCVGRDRLEYSQCTPGPADARHRERLRPHRRFPEGQQGAGGNVLYDLDSVQMVEFIREVREQTGFPFYISAAVSPFKYTEPDCAYQYLKLEKKIAAGADYAITQLGYDSRQDARAKTVHG